MDQIISKYFPLDRSQEEGQGQSTLNNGTSAQNTIANSNGQPPPPPLISSIIANKINQEIGAASPPNVLQNDISRTHTHAHHHSHQKLKYVQQNIETLEIMKLILSAMFYSVFGVIFTKFAFHIECKCDTSHQKNWSIYAGGLLFSILCMYFIFTISQKHRTLRSKYNYYKQMHRNNNNAKNVENGGGDPNNPMFVPYSQNTAVGGGDIMEQPFPNYTQASNPANVLKTPPMDYTSVMKYPSERTQVVYGGYPGNRVSNSFVQDTRNPQRNANQYFQGQMMIPPPNASSVYKGCGPGQQQQQQYQTCYTATGQPFSCNAAMPHSPMKDGGHAFNLDPNGAIPSNSNVFMTYPMDGSNDSRFPGTPPYPGSIQPFVGMENVMNVGKSRYDASPSVYHDSHRIASIGQMPHSTHRHTHAHAHANTINNDDHQECDHVNSFISQTIHDFKQTNAQQIENGSWSPSAYDTMQIM